MHELLMSSYMEINQELKKSIRQHKNSCTAQGKTLYAHGSRISSSKSRQRTKAKKDVDGLNSNMKHEVRLGANDMFSGQPKLSATHQGQFLEENTSSDDELVKYMSNLPHYLETEKDEKFQEKVLNVGVLDWAQLENWKRKQRHLQAKVGKHASSVPSFSSVYYSNNYARQKQPNFLSSNANKLSHKNCTSRNVKPSSQRSIRLGEPEVVPETTLKELLDIDKREDISSEVSSKIEIETPLPKLRDCRISHNVKHNGRVRTTEAEETLLEVMKRDDEHFADTTFPILPSRNRDVSSRSMEKESIKKAKTKRRAKKSLDSGISLDDADCHGEQNNIVLLFPRNSRRQNFAKIDPYIEPRVPPAKSSTRKRENVTEQNEKHVLNGQSKENVKSFEPRQEISYSDSLQSTAEGKAEKYIMPHNLYTEENQKSSCKFSLPDDMLAKLPEDRSAEQYKFKTSSVPKSVDEKEDKCRSNMSSILGKNLKVLDQETAEREDDKVGRSLPNQQFSIPWLSRSLSLKEGHRVPHLSSTHVSFRSGPINSELPAELGTSNGRKVNDRSKSSSLRRWLDPLLRFKGTKPSQSTVSVQPSKGNFDLDFKPINSSGYVIDKRDDISTLQATLQLTIKNDLPFYKLLVNNGTEILAASTKLFNAPDKDECGQSYILYTINEIKKKDGSRFIHGNKDRSSGYAYNVLGQMNVSDCSSTNLTGECTDDYPSLREAVLYSAELRQADNDTPKLILNQEIAAVVIKEPTEVLSNDIELSEKDNNSLNKRCTECLIGDSCVCKIRGSQACQSTTVLLPGGIHGMPMKGGPSSLINRWKTGGLCDCGGWDVDCKLRVLSIENHFNSRITCKNCALPVSNCFELHDQGEARQDRPVLSLAASEEGAYIVKFDASISVLQAFFICVAIVSDKNISSHSGLTDLAESKVALGTLLKDNNIRCPPIISVQGSYVPSPPNSPVRRA